MKPLAYEHLPQLDLPRLDLGCWPTPVALAALDGLEGRLWVKDEGASGPLYGGNKIRKLEMLLGRAKAEGYSDVITMGAAGSNHALATALYAADNDLRAHAVLVPQPTTDHVKKNLSLTARNASVHRSWHRLTIPLGIAWRSLQVWRAHGRLPMFIQQGGSDALGTVGWVSAGLEIAAEVEAGRMPAPERVYCAFGSGGTAAGLLVGLRLGGLDSEVVATQVVDQPIGARWLMNSLARGAERLLRERGGLDRQLDLSGLRLETGWLAGGYGHADERVHAVLEEGTAAGLHLEATYTAKSLGRCLEELRGPDAPETAVWIATLNHVDLGPLDTSVPVPAELSPLLG